MSMMIIATSLSAVGAAALTVGGLALHRRLTARAKAQFLSEVSPIESFAAEHAALSSLNSDAPGLSRPHVLAANLRRFEDPQAAVAEVREIQIRVTAAAALDGRPLNTAISTSSEARHDA